MKSPISRSPLNKLLLARRLYELGRENLSSANDLSLSIGVNLLQDSVETFLLAISEYVNAKIETKTTFDRYFELIDARICPNKLPFRSRLNALNKLRVNSKHYGLSPSQSEVSGLLPIVREFFENTTSDILGISFSSVSLIDLLRDGEAKDVLREAESAFLRGDFDACLFGCRKAIFIRVESDYDVRPYETDAENPFAFWMFSAKAPYYARNKDYIAKSVNDATDYIVLDHSAIELELIKSGMDSVSFWNVWRLTPAVYRRNNKEHWVEKRDLRKLDPDGIKERAEYVLDTTINLLAAADQKYAAKRQIYGGKYYVTLRKDQAPIYKKASMTSEVVGTTPPGLYDINVDFSIRALAGDGTFWHVFHAQDGIFLDGYVPMEAFLDPQ